MKNNKLKNAVIYFECFTGLIISKIAIKKINETKSLKNINCSIYDNLNEKEFQKILKGNFVRTIIYISDDYKYINLLENRKIRIIKISLKNFVKFPWKY